MKFLLKFLPVGTIFGLALRAIDAVIKNPAAQEMYEQDLLILAAKINEMYAKVGDIPDLR